MDEFIHSYSDDLIYLDQIEDILETQQVTFVPMVTLGAHAFGLG